MRRASLLVSLCLSCVAAAQTPKDAMQQAEAALEKGDYPAAEALLAPLTTKDPHNAMVLYDLGFAEERNGKDGAAAESYKAAIAADARMAEPRVALGLLEAREGDHDGARAALASAADMPSATPALRARAYRALAQLDEVSNPAAASDELLKAIDLDGEKAGDTLLSAELAEQAGDLPQSEQAYVKALAANPDNLEARVGLAHVLKAEGKVAAAESVLQTGLQSHPDDVRLVTQLAAVLVAGGKSAQAIPLLEQLRLSSPQSAQDPELTDMLAHLYTASDKPAQAEPLYRAALARNPDDPRLQDDLASTLVRLEKFAEAEELLRSAVAHRDRFHDDHAWAEAQGHLAFAASRNHDPQTTLAALAARASVLPETPVTTFLAATANDSLHKNKDAVRLYRAFLALSKGGFPNEEFEARHRLVALEHER